LRKVACGSFYARDIELVAAWLNGTKDEIEPLAGIVLIQAHFKVRRLIVVVKIHRAPFNVEDSIGRAA
jgi:hypothetical protein